ncbi:MAG: hypothetical protein H7Z40_05530 [Phycisphaerae bacterium]|nr:hypothetical protein [Gemmatimonadaceae bacterium]
MLAYRWLLGIVLAGLGGSFIVLSIVASGFRKSFGASPMNPLVSVLPVVAMLVLLGGLIAPGNRPLRHGGAIAAVGLIGFCGWLMITEPAPSIIFGFLHLAAWLYFYWRTGAPQLLFQ